MFSCYFLVLTVLILNECTCPDKEMILEEKWLVYKEENSQDVHISNWVLVVFYNLAFLPVELREICEVTDDTQVA